MATTKGSSPKDVVYIDVDDEITAIIDKVRSSSGKIVALVLPKRAAVMQSIVNMKLLKRTAAEAKKHVVLITSEASLLPLAGIAGVHVAKTLQSKPEIPEAPAAPDEMPVSADDNDTGPSASSDDAPVDKQKSVGELAGSSPAPQKNALDDEAIEVDNDDAEELTGDEPKTAGAGDKVPLNKKLRIPDFDKFRLRLILGIAAFLLLVIGWFVAFYVMPRATVTIRTDTVSVTSDLSLTGSVSAKEANEQQMIVPAVVKDLKKTDSQKVPATGQRDDGTKASGTVTLALGDCASPQVTVPSGTTVSAGGLNFITQADAVLTSVKIGVQCRNSDFKEFSTRTVNVVAQNAGGQYNLSARSYTVAGFSNVSGSGSAMTGGTSKIVKVVSQEDIDGAKQKILDANNATAKQDVAKQLKTEGYMSLEDTFAPANPLVTASPNVGGEANEVTVNVTVTYTMHGVKEDAVKTLLENDIKKKIDTSKQNILNNGLDKPTIRIGEKNNTQVKFTLQTVAQAGVQQDSEAIKKAVAGKKKGEVQSIILARPGVKDVTVKYSPFWVYSTPGSAKKITIIFEQNDGNAGR